MHLKSPIEEKKVKLWLRLEPTKVLSSLGSIEFAPIIWIFKKIRLNLGSVLKLLRLYGKLQMQIVFLKICDSVHDKTSGIAT